MTASRTTHVVIKQMCCLENQLPGFHMDVTLILATYPNISADYLHTPHGNSTPLHGIISSLSRTAVRFPKTTLKWVEVLTKESEVFAQSSDFPDTNLMASVGDKPPQGAVANALIPNT